MIAAYKKQALLHHPDRLGDNATPQEREQATRAFQLIADAYYILGDPERRATYDRSRQKQNVRSAPTSETTPNISPGDAHRVFGDVFEELLRPEGNIYSYARSLSASLVTHSGFLAKNKVEHPTYLWRILGAGAGAILGFIIGNIGGAAVVRIPIMTFEFVLKHSRDAVTQGAVTGRTLGKIRDNKGMHLFQWIW